VSKINVILFVLDFIVKLVFGRFSTAIVVAVVVMVVMSKARVEIGWSVGVARFIVTVVPVEAILMMP
jgi:hypothetical protein